MIVNNVNKAGFVAGGTTGIGSYVAMYLFQKWGVPVEVTAAVVAGIGWIVGRYAGKLDPRA